jgi:MFS family permease
MAGSANARNLLFLSAVESFWGFGMNLVSMGTVLPVFLAGQGASNGVIALIPALSALGMGLPQVFSGLIAGRGGTLRGWVIGIHLVIPLPLAVTAALLKWSTLPPIPLVLAAWGLFYALIGVVIPLRFEYMARILDPARRGRAFGMVFFLQTALGASGLAAAAALLEDGTSLGTYALLFALAWAATTAGGLFFLGTREERPSEAPRASGLVGHLKSLADLLRRTGWMAAFLSSRWLVRGCYPLLLHFYAVFAVVHRGASPAEAALFGAAGLVGQAIAGVAAGLLGDRLGHKLPTLLGQAGLAVACFLVLLPLPTWIFYPVAVLTGVFLSTEYTSQVNWVMDLSALEDRPGILALTGFLMTPSAVVAPLAGGWVMDRAGFPAVSAAVGLILLVAMLAELLLVPSRLGVKAASLLR